MSADKEAFVLSRTDLVEGRSSDPGIWHGTAMAEEFLRGVSLTDTAAGGSAVRLRLYNAYGANETATSFDVTRGVLQAADDGVRILSLSLGGPEPSPMLQEALASFTEQGGLVFVAAGNQGSVAPFYPAADPRVIAVTAVNREGNPMPWANRGDYVDVGAPGVTYIPFQGQTWVVRGTSPATALTAGMAAGYADRTGAPLGAVPKRQNRLSQDIRAQKTPPWPYETGPFYRRDQVGTAGSLPPSYIGGLAWDCLGNRFDVPEVEIRSKDAVSIHVPGREN
jgi:hypothetical protein